ncbi:MAG: DM13 domain-containing protein, partial [Chloroflexi bacterium]|nr:DM13 domain-containing protein [Chloroflexota bacterium]
RRATATRKRKTISAIALAIAIAVAIPAFALAWWLFSPLFNNVTVDEEFPLTVDATIPEGVTRDEAESMMETAAKINMDADDAMTPSMAAADAVEISTGQFEDEDFIHKGSGDATIYRLGNGANVLRLESLDVTNGPDLHVLLLKDPEGRDKTQGYLDLGGLKGNKGNQNYGIPDGEDVTEYKSAMIYCQPFHVIFSIATLTLVDATGT